MPRRHNPDLVHRWKVSIPATLAGKMEAVLFDDITNKPLYGARAHLIKCLLENWLAREAGAPEDELPPVPSAAELKTIGWSN